MAAPNSAIESPDFFPAMRAVSFSNRIEIEKRPNSWAIPLISSATPGFPVWAIKPIVFGCMQKTPDSHPRL